MSLGTMLMGFLSPRKWRSLGRKVLAGLTGALLLLHPTSAAAQVVEYYHLDALGNVRAITDQNAQVVERHDYLPFGEEWDPQPGTQPLRFTGKERDEETGLDYFGARYYASSIGRFTSVDPAMTIQANLVDPQRWNRYAYVRNNPYKYVDPNGEDPLPTELREFFDAFLRSDYARVDVHEDVSFVPRDLGITVGRHVLLGDLASEQYRKRTKTGLGHVGHELIHTDQGQLNKMYLAEFLGGLASSGSPGEAYASISSERSARLFQYAIHDFLSRNRDIHRDLQEGSRLTPRQMGRVLMGLRRSAPAAANELEREGSAPELPEPRRIPGSPFSEQ